MSEFKLDLSALTPLRADPYPFTDFHLEWLKALRSGKYKQGQGMLRDHSGAYCCLGVLCEVLGAERKRVEHMTGYSYKLPGDDVWSTTGYPSTAIRKAGLLRTDLGKFVQSVRFPGLDYSALPEGDVYGGGHRTLASMNDVRMIPAVGGLRAFTFREIADYIEFDPWNVFAEPGKTETKAEAAEAAFA